jgi:Aldo/keto reductase family
MMSATATLSMPCNLNIRDAVSTMSCRFCSACPLVKRNRYAPSRSLDTKTGYRDTPEKGRFSAELGGFGQAYHARYWHEREFETVAGVQEIAKQHGTPITTLSIAWVLANPAITSVILGASRVEQLTDTLAAADYKLDGALKGRLDEVSVEFCRGDGRRATV